MMRLRCFMIFVLGITILPVLAQKPDTTFFADRNVEELALFAGYNLNGGLNKQYLNIFELGIKRNFQIHPFEAFCKSIYISNEFLYAHDKFMIGPKVGASVSAMMITLGLESIFYTDFSGQSIKLSPYIGLGSNRVKLTLNFPINLYKNDFDYINPVTLHISFQYLILWSKKYGQIHRDEP